MTTILPSDGHTGRAVVQIFDEARRQLTICNACRYCEGFCAVYPALERRDDLSDGDLVQLGNLCHDCRACLYACMYAPPHEFMINPPKILSEVRAASWTEGITDSGAPTPRVNARAAAAVAFAVVTTVIVLLAGATEGLSHLWHGGAGARSPYGAISYPALLVAMAVPFAFGALIMARAGVRQWRRTRGPLRDLLNLRAWNGALADAGQLRYLKGGGADCEYPTEVHSPARRYLHAALAYGFTLCLVSTIAAGVSQDLVGVEPPYSWLSVPVIAGTIGGIGLLLGSTGLFAMKTHSDPEPTDEKMKARDYHLLAVLALLGGTGLLTLFTRTTAAYGIVLTLHLAVVGSAFVLAPFTKFNHVLYRLLALVQDRIEIAEQHTPTG